MSRAELLIKMQKRAFVSSPWHAFLPALEAVAEDVFTFVPENHSGFPWMNGSIQDILYHVTGDKLVQLDHAFGDASLTWDNISITKASLAQMVPDLESADSKVAAALAAQDRESLSRKVTAWGGKSMSCEDFFLMLIEHDLYHAGQVRCIRNLLEKR